MFRGVIIGVVSALACTLAAPAAEIAGRIRITRGLTKKRISINQVYERAAALAPAPVEIGTFQEELKRVVIHLEGGPPATMRRTAVMDQRQRRFHPEVLAIPAGSAVSFPNSDPIFHNVFSLSKPKEFDLGNYPNGQSRTITFEKPGVVLVHCHLHPNMSAAIVVTPTDWYARPDSEGGYSLKNVQPGLYTLVAWHKAAGTFRRTVELKDETPVVVDFEIPIKEVALHR